MCINSLQAKSCFLGQGKCEISLHRINTLFILRHEFLYGCKITIYEYSNVFM